MSGIPPWFSTIAPVITLVLGWFLSQQSERAKEERQLKRDELAADRESKGKTSDRRTSFQRETLLQIQESMAALVRATAKIHHEDTLVSRTSGQWGRQQLPEEWSDKHFNAALETRKRKVRIDDAELRNLVDTLLNLCGDVASAETQEDSLGFLAQVVAVHEEVTNRLGVILRG